MTTYYNIFFLYYNGTVDYLTVVQFDTLYVPFVAKHNRGKLTSKISFD